MNTPLDCIPCMTASLLRIMQNNHYSDDQKTHVMRKILEFLARVDYRQSPPALSREMFRMVRNELALSDLYRNVKDAGNREMLAMYPRFREKIRLSEYPLQTAMRLAVAGNVIDFGPQHRLHVMDTIDKVLNAQFAVDDSELLIKDLKKAGMVLYVGDNCGEIVLDKLFIETMNHPNIYFAVRNAPVINDATLDDARSIGLDQRVKMLTTGDDAPGAVWETASQEFKEAVRHADVIISKGQGNLEGLMDVDFNIYFLLVVKCDHIGRRIGARRGDYVVKSAQNNGGFDDKHKSG